MGLNLWWQLEDHWVTEIVREIRWRDDNVAWFASDKRGEVAVIINDYIDKQRETAGFEYWEQKSECIRSIGTLKDWEKATLMIMSGHEIDRVAAAALLIRKYPDKIWKVVVTAAIGWLDDRLLRDISSLTEAKIEQQISHFKQKNWWDISDGIHVPENTKKDERGRYITQAESMVQFLLKYCWSVIVKHKIEIVGDESSVCSISNLTQPFHSGAITETDKHIYIISDGFHELRVVWEYALQLGSEGTHRNPWVNSFDATLEISPEEAQKNRERFSGFLSVESIFRELSWLGEKQDQYTRLNTLRTSTALPVWYYAGWDEHTKNLLRRWFWSLSSNFIPADQAKRDASLMTRFIPEETKDIGPSGWKYILARNGETGKLGYRKKEIVL